ncbi:MAG TPA: hypothetical protein VLZ74_16775 [Methylocella sp.]|nr:hypothetical protein [Methylocella sp.]
MPELDQLLSALFLVSLLLYWCLPPLDTEGRRWFQLGAIFTLGTAMAVALAASVSWLTR